MPSAWNSGGRRAGLALGQRHIGVDAGSEGHADGAHIVRAIGRPLGLHVAAIDEEALRPVLREKARPEIGREQAQAALPPQIDLPEAIARRVEALGEEEVVEALRPDMRDAVAIDRDLGRRLQAGQRERLPVGGVPGGCICGAVLRLDRSMVWGLVSSAASGPALCVLLGDAALRDDVFSGDDSSGGGIAGPLLLPGGAMGRGTAGGGVVCTGLKRRRGAKLHGRTVRSVLIGLLTGPILQQRRFVV